MDNYIAKDFGKLLKQNLLQLRGFFNDTDTNIGRLYDYNMSDLPISVDLWGPYLLIGGRIDPSFKDEIGAVASSMAYVPPEKVLFPGEGSGITIDVKEHGLTYQVELGWPNAILPLTETLLRREVLVGSLGKRVLVVGARGGGFSVCGASGGAHSVVSSEHNQGLRQYCIRNLSRNRFRGDLYPCSNLGLEEALTTKGKYDLIVIDTTSWKGGNFRTLHNSGLELLNKGGHLLFITDNTTLNLQTKEIGLQLMPEGFTTKRFKMRCWISPKP
ncbi:MAG: class I SAM-dependent methyltransferase [Sphaerochaetaceae bacterium]|nr:class I SAM-dependent methyltransferase [Sphaerochaetaceae bacterium]HHU88436.1 hypothetical protein [Spirochaetales bacterium]